MSLRNRRILITLVVLSACLVFMTPQEGISARYGQVTQMRLEASPRNHEGPCPVTIHFRGSITVDGPNTVIYGIFRSDGATGKGDQTLHFTAAGTKPVHTTWTLGGPGMNFRGWLQIGSGDKRSNKAEFAIHCQK